MRTTTDVSYILYPNCLVDRLIGFLHKEGKHMKMFSLLKPGG